MSLSAYVIINRPGPHKIEIRGDDGKTIDTFDVRTITVEQDKATVKPYIFVDLSAN